MTTARIEVWIWVLVYIGMILLGLGLSVQRSDLTLGWCIAALGIVLTAVGAYLVFARSRIKDKKSST
jgi:hypothetical protein